LQKRTVKKKYYGKSEYSYTVYSLNIPRRFHELLKPLLNRDLDVDTLWKNGALILIIRPRTE